MDMRRFFLIPDFSNFTLSSELPELWSLENESDLVIDFFICFDRFDFEEV